MIVETEDRFSPSNKAGTETTRKTFLKKKDQMVRTELMRWMGTLFAEIIWGVETISCF
jgi:hypothetical protein